MANWKIIHVQFRNEVLVFGSVEKDEATQRFFKWCLETESDPLEYELKRVVPSPIQSETEVSEG